MREIIVIGIGEAGINISNDLINLIAEEHEIQKNQVDKARVSPKSPKPSEISEEMRELGANIYFSEWPSGKRKSRSILIDLDSTPINRIQGKPHIYNESNLLYNNNSSGGNWATAFYNSGDLIEEFSDALRGELELTESAEVFQIIHSLEGGTGSGLFSALIPLISDEFGGIIREAVSVFGEKEGRRVEGYNEVLSMEALLNCNEVLYFNNSAIERIYKNIRGIRDISYKDINRNIVDIVSTESVCMRLGGSKNNSIRKTLTNTVPFPNLHFFASSSAPWSMSPEMENITNIEQLGYELQMYDHVHSLVDIRHGRQLAQTQCYRGVTLPEMGIDCGVLNPQNKSSSYFVEWIPGNILWGKSTQSIRGKELFATCLMNTTTFIGVLEGVMKNFGGERGGEENAYIHHFLSQGLEQGLVIDGVELLTGLKEEYARYQDVICDEEPEDDEQDDHIYSLC